jgi:outer membrane protein assembly factor BamB
VSRRPETKRLRAALSETRVPDAGAAEDRGWAVVRSAFAAREPVPRTPARARRFAAAAATAAIAAAIALTPAGADVRDWLADAISPGEPNARPVLGSLPAPGSLLVEAGDGVWIQREDGGRRLLGEYDHATWSPHGLYVGAAQGRELFALTPAGEVRWSLDAPARIRSLEWSADEGYRIAYVAGSSLRIVAGDGTGDARIRERLGSTAIAWRPESVELAARHELAFVDRRHRVTMLDTDSGDVAWRSARFGGPVEELQWSADGKRLLVAGDGFGTLLTAAGEPILKGLAAGTGPIGLAPDGRSVAAIQEGTRGGARLVLEPGVPGRRSVVLYRAPAAAAGSFGRPAFSPDGDWILLPWPAADQWLFVRADGGRVEAVAEVSRQFDPDRRAPAADPRVAGWCC